jgi:dimethylaniline monooxygenase (N-oxide forming)
MKICVIGAGAAGLSAIKNGVEHGCQVTCFELSDKVGGLWNLTDDFGEEVHSSMYHGLRTNLPIELMCYPDLPFPEQEESFVSSQEVLRYYQWYAGKFDLRKFVKFQHLVVRVRPLTDGKWEVIVLNIKTNVYESLNFDAVFVCNGHFQHGFVPKYEGQDTFKGKQFHSHDYRKPETLKDENLLVIGGAFSGSDIVQDCSKFARHVTWSHHLEQKLDHKYFAENVDQKTDVKKFTENGVEFVDGTKRDFSVVIYCTGYEYKFPFLSVDCGISTEEGYVKPLFMHCLSINHPSLAIIGLSNLICPNQMFDLQVRFCLTFMTAKKKLPSKEEMTAQSRADLKIRWDLGLPKKKAHYLVGELQAKYYKDLAELAGIKPIRTCIPKMHRQCLDNRKEDFGSFRKFKFQIVDDENFSFTKL